LKVEGGGERWWGKEGVQKKKGLKKHEGNRPKRMVKAANWKGENLRGKNPKKDSTITDKMLGGGSGLSPATVGKNGFMCPLGMAKKNGESKKGKGGGGSCPPRWKGPKMNPRSVKKRIKGVQFSFLRTQKGGRFKVEGCKNSQRRGPQKKTAKGGHSKTFSRKQKLIPGKNLGGSRQPTKTRG